MTAELLLENLLAWAGQVCVLVAVAWGAALLLKDPKARLLFWQGTLAIAVLLPLFEPFHQAAFVPAGDVVFPRSPATTPLVTHAAGFFLRSEYVLAMLAAGAALRMIWIAAGFVRLRRHRLSARVLSQPPVPFDRSRVRWYLSDTVTGPVTFGWWRPSILLPTRVNEFPDDLREAIACHELMHVRRRDWLFVLAEELTRAVLWFHPAIWLVLSRIQLAREQTVDLEVVRLTDNRERYLDALVAVAAQRLQPDVAPAPLFLKQRQLASRVAAVLNFKEGRMSKPAIAGRFLTVSSAALFAVRLAVWFFPLQAPAQMIPDSPGIAVDPGGALMHRTPVFYQGTVSGTVTLNATLNQKGEVIDANVLSGPDELRKPAIRSVLDWHYAAGASSARVTINFAVAPPEEPAAVPSHRESMAVITPFAPEMRPIIRRLEFVGVSPEVEQEIRQRLPVREGDVFTPAILARVMVAAKEVDEHFIVSMATNMATSEVSLHFSLGFPPSPGTAAMSIPAGIPGAVQGVPGGVLRGLDSSVPPPSVVKAAAPDHTPRIRVGENVQAANLISKVTPEYPPLAKQARIQGTVRFTVTIGKEGTVENLQVTSGHPLLIPAAVDAVKQWVYKPTLLNGQPVEVITQVDVDFSLSQ